MHIGWAMIFDPLPEGGAPSLEVLRSQTAERLELLPRFLRRLSSPRVGSFSLPTWEPDPDFDIATHMRHATLPAPGGEAELLDWLGDFYSHRLDRAHPLWETTLLDGLADGRWALATKVHHCLVDGIGGASVTSALLDAEPNPPPGSSGLTVALAPPPEDEDAGAARCRSSTARWAAASMPRCIRASLPRPCPGPGRWPKWSIREELIGAHPHQPQRADRRHPAPGGGRCAARRPEADQARAGRHRQRRRPCRLRRRPATLLRAPRGGRTWKRQGNGPGQRAPGRARLALGNRVSSLFVELPVAEPDPLLHYRETVAAAEELKGATRSMGTETLIEVAGAAPPLIHSVVARLAFTPRLFNITITNVPGPQTTLYVLGAPMRRLVPLVPISPATPSALPRSATTAKSPSG